MKSSVERGATTTISSEARRSASARSRPGLGGLAIVAGGLSIVLLAGCTSAAAPSPSESSIQVSPSALPATPEPSDMATPSESVPVAGEKLSNVLTDDAGYRTRVVVTNMQVSTTSDVANQKPGRAEVTVQLSADAVLTNLAPKHNVTSSDILGVLPAWKRKSPPCAASVRQAARSSFEAITIGGANQWNDEATEFCVLRGLWAAPGKNGALEPNESRSLALAQNLASASGGYPPERVQVPEENLERVEAALNKPDFWIMMRYIGDYDVTNADGVCRDSSGAIAVVATTAGGKGLCSRIVTDGTR